MSAAKELDSKLPKAEYKEPSKLDEATTKTVTWTDPRTGQVHEWTFKVHPLSYEDSVEWQTRLSHICNGRSPDSFDEYPYLRATCIARTVFKAMPGWAVWLLANSPEFAFTIAGLVEDATNSFRTKYGAASNPTTGEPAFKIS